MMPHSHSRHSLDLEISSRRHDQRLDQASDHTMTAVTTASVLNSDQGDEPWVTQEGQVLFFPDLADSFCSTEGLVEL